MKQFHAVFEILQPVAGEFGMPSPVARDSMATVKTAELPDASEDRLLVDFSKGAGRMAPGLQRFLGRATNKRGTK